MKSKIRTAALAMLFFAMPALAQTVRMHGVVTDLQGKPVENAVLDMKNSDNGWHVSMKTNKKGEYLNVGVQPGPFNYTLKSKDGQILAQGKLTVPAQDEYVEDFDLRNGTAAPAAAGAQPGAEAAPAATAAPTQKQLQQLTPEQKKQLEAAQKEQAAVAAENATIQQINAKLNAARSAASAGNLQQAIDLLKPVADAGSKYDIIYGQLGDFELQAMKKAPPAQTAQLTQSASAHLTKAIELLTASPDAQKDPAKTNLKLGVYNGELAETQARSGQFDAAMLSADKAAQYNKTGAEVAYFNLGALAVNGGKSQIAANAFDKCTQVNPQNADCYYQKGAALLGLSKTEGEKLVAPPGTAEAFNKYLELKPQGTYAEAAKQMLETIGAKVSTTYKK